MPLTAREYNRLDPIARVFAMRIRVAGIVPIAGDDRYIDGTGSMRGRLLRVVPVANGRGREFDLGELVTWLNDAVMLAPSMLLVAPTTWCAVDDGHVDVSVTDGPNAVTARVELGADGLAVDFVRTDRWSAGTNPPRRTEWRTPWPAWATTAGWTRPTAGHAIWRLDDGEFADVGGTFDPATFEVAPTTWFDGQPGSARADSAACAPGALL